MNEKQENPRFCPNCGQPWEPGSRFCGECGQTVSTASVPDASVTMPPPAASVEPAALLMEKKQKHFKWRGLAVGLCILAAGLGLVYAGYITDFFGLGQVDKKVAQIKTPAPVKKPKPKPVSVKKPANVFDKAMLSKYVTSVRFFESGSSMPPPYQRFYKNDFAFNETRYINWELNLRYPAALSRSEFNIEAVWRRSDGSIHARETFHAYIEPGWNNSAHASGWGNNRSGTWLPGIYMVELYVEGKKIASGRFRIF